MNMHKLCWVAVLVMLPAFPFQASGQDYTYKGSAYGGIGFGSFNDDEGRLGSGLTYRAGAEWRLLPRVALEGELYGIKYRRRDYFHVDGNAQFVLANGTFYFTRSKVQPYIKWGIGAHRMSFTYSWPSSSAEGFHRSKSSLASGAGAGIKIFVNRRWSVNPDFRFIAARGNYFLLSYVSVTAAWHWAP